MGHGKMTVNSFDADINRHYSNVLTDFAHLKDEYPFSYLTLFPLKPPMLAKIRVVAVSKKLIEKLCAVETDFLGSYSKQLQIYVPVDYQQIGCKVFGGAWIDPTKFKEKDIHFYRPVRSDGYEFCVGTPESFPLLKNVILENVKTADNMMVAYESVMTGNSEHLNLIAYSHGGNGRREFKCTEEYKRWRQNHGRKI